jgi:hypothetical protein
MPEDPNRSVPLCATIAVIQAAESFIHTRQPKHHLAMALREIYNDLEAEHANESAEDET